MELSSFFSMSGSRPILGKAVRLNVTMGINHKRIYCNIKSAATSSGAEHAVILLEPLTSATRFSKKSDKNQKKELIHYRFATELSSLWEKNIVCSMLI